MNLIRFEFTSEEDYKKAEALIRKEKIDYSYMSEDCLAIAVSSIAESAFFSVKLESNKIPYSYKVEGDTHEST